MNSDLTREEKIEALKRELENLKAELKKARTPFQRSVLIDEMRAVSRQLARLLD